MADRFILSHVTRLPLFQHLTPQQLELVAGQFQVLRYEAGQIIARQGDPAQGLFLFVSGRGALLQQGQDNVERHVGSVSPGNYVGEKALFSDLREVATLQVVQPAIVLFLSRQHLNALLAQYPDITHSLRIGLQTNRDTSRKVAVKAFEQQRENEVALLIGRQHWWAFARKVWIAAFLAALLVAASIFVGRVTPLLAFAFLGLAVIGPGLVMFYFYLDWQADKIIVTDQRILNIRVDWGIFRTHISEVPLDSVIEVNYEVPTADPMARVFNYGTVVIKTPGAAGNVVLDFIAEPARVQELIFSNRQRFKDAIAEAGRNAIRDEIERSLRGESEPSVPPVQNMSKAENTLRPLRHTSFISTHFINEDGESVYRKHIVNWLGHIFLPTLVILGGLVVGGLALVNESLQSTGVIGFMLAFFLMLVGIVWFYFADWDWRNDVYVVGNTSIKLIRKRPFWLQNETDQILLTQVDNVVSNINGPVETLIQRGDVLLFLVGADTNNAKVFECVYRPGNIQEEISHKQALAREHVAEEEARRQRQAIADYLAVYHQTVAPPAPSATPEPPVQPPPPPELPDQPPPPIRDAVRPPRIPRPRQD